MKKRLGILLLSCLLALLLTSCDEVLSVVTVGENGEKVVNSYVSMFGDKVYDETASFNKNTSRDKFSAQAIFSYHAT